MADGGEDGGGGIAGAAFELAAAEVALGLHVADDWLDGGSTSQLALDGAEHAAFLTRDEDAARVLRVRPRYPFRHSRMMSQRELPGAVSSGGPRLVGNSGPLGVIPFPVIQSPVVSAFHWGDCEWCERRAVQGSAVLVLSF